jgi:hypothetical protein
MTLTPAPVSAYLVTFLAAGMAVLVTNRRGCMRLLRIIARNVFVLVIVLFLYQSTVEALALLPASSLSSLSAVKSAAAPPALGSDRVVGGPSLSAGFINHVLAVAGSPAAGTGQALYDLSVQYDIDDAYALATFWHESSYGKAGWAFTDHSLGNIVCAGYPTCNQRFRWYASWQEGYADFYRLIAREYVARGLVTLDTIIPVYAPSVENNPAEYIKSLRDAMLAYRSGQLV